jgi:hypothetical protein
MVTGATSCGAQDYLSVRVKPQKCFDMRHNGGILKIEEQLAVEF